MYEGDEINSFGGNGTFDRPGAIVSSSPDEQQNAASAKPQKAPKAPRFPRASKAPKVPKTTEQPSFISPISNPVSIAERSPRRINKMPIILGVAAVGVIALIAVIISIVSSISRSIKQGEESVLAGEPNVNAIFDKDAPIPYRNSIISEYGYIDQAGDKWIIARQFTDAEPFFGNYAKAKKDGKNVVIDRNGKVVLEEAEDATVNYLIKENVWVVGEDIYNGSLKKANHDNTKADYVGYGYALVIPKSNGDNENQTGVPYVVSVKDSERVFDCQTRSCAVLASRGTHDKKAYLGIYDSTKGSSIYDVEGKKEIYRVSGDNVLVKITDGVYAEKSRTNNTTVKYISVNDGSANVSNTIPVIASDDSISGAGSYYIKTCEDKTYKITNASGEEVVKCGIRTYWELPYIVYRKFEKDEKSAILIQQENEVSLYDLDHKKVLKTYNNAGDVELFENSPFVKMSAGSGKKQICNLLNTGANCVNIMNNEEIVAYPTFIRVGRVTYSYGLTEVYNASKE